MGAKWSTEKQFKVEKNELLAGIAKLNKVDRRVPHICSKASIDPIDMNSPVQTKKNTTTATTTTNDGASQPEAAKMGPLDELQACFLKRGLVSLEELRSRPGSAQDVLALREERTAVLDMPDDIVDVVGVDAVAECDTSIDTVDDTNLQVETVAPETTSTDASVVADVVVAVDAIAAVVVDAGDESALVDDNDDENRRIDIEDDGDVAAAKACEPLESNNVSSASSSVVEPTTMLSEPVYDESDVVDEPVATIHKEVQLPLDDVCATSFIGA